MRLARALLLATVVAAFSIRAASAQPSPAADPIGDLLGQREPDAGQAEGAAAKVRVPGARVDADPSPAPRAYVRPTAPKLSRPVYIDETGRNPDAPPSPAEAAYDDRLKSSAASARGFQGPLDGAWTLSGGGRDLYALQLIDRNGVVEGAWRDLRRTGALDASGFIEGVERRGADVTFRFSGGAAAALRSDGGGWRGELTEGGRTETVSLARRNP